MKVNHRSRKPGIMIINIRLNRMLTWHIVLSLNGERALSMYNIYVDHIIQHSGIYSIWILEHLKILIKFLMKIRLGAGNTYFGREKSALTQPAVQSN